MVKDVEFWVQGSGFRVSSVGCRVQGSEFRVQAVAIGVYHQQPDVNYIQVLEKVNFSCTVTPEG